MTTSNEIINNLFKKIEEKISKEIFECNLYSNIKIPKNEIVYIFNRGKLIKIYRDKYEESFNFDILKSKYTYEKYLGTYTYENGKSFFSGLVFYECEDISNEIINILTEIAD